MSIAAICAALVSGFAIRAWFMPAEFASAELRVLAGAHEFGSGDGAFMEVADSSIERTSLLSFDERFPFESPPAPERLQSSDSWESFDALIRGETPHVDGIRRGGFDVPLQRPIRSTSTVVTLPRPNPRAGAVNGGRPAPRGGFQLASASETPIVLGYAPADAAKNAGSGPLNGLLPGGLDLPADIDTSRTAIYDITSRKVYLPNGRQLEAHSGLGQHMDDPRYVAVRMTGPTPPNVYDLKERESLFHGVRAIRLLPKDGSKMYGRDGILAHTYMLGPNGQSNGCVSFKDYQVFLDAYLRGDITRLVVVERLAGGPASKTASGWVSEKLKELFRRS